ncbi:hypothetical protein ACP4OV_013180 [Aristida adscensionis]
MADQRIPNGGAGGNSKAHQQRQVGRNGRQAGGGGGPERRLPRPAQDQALPCPRCASTNTKFCYYNNYSTAQPRFFCRACRRYWTLGGSLRNVPVGGGCRKNNKRCSGAAAAVAPSCAMEAAMAPPPSMLPSDAMDFSHVFPAFADASYLAPPPSLRGAAAPAGVADVTLTPPSFLEILRAGFFGTGATGGNQNGDGGGGMVAPPPPPPFQHGAPSAGGAGQGQQGVEDAAAAGDDETAMMERQLWAVQIGNDNNGVIADPAADELQFVDGTPEPGDEEEDTHVMMEMDGGSNGGGGGSSGRRGNYWNNNNGNGGNGGKGGAGGVNGGGSRI